MFNVYKISNNINDKVYIGVTTRTIEERFAEHKYRIEERNSIHLYQAMKKYGKENFKIELIDTANSKEEMFEKEKYYIKYYDSYNNGYNLTYGGEGGKRLELDEAYILEQYLNGKSTSEIAAELKVGENTIRRRLKSLGVELNWHKNPEWMYEYMIEEYKKPRLIREIAEELGLSYDNISFYLRKNNIPRHKFTKSYPDGRKWYEEFKNGSSMTSLSKKYNVDRKTIARIFNYYRIIDNEQVEDIVY